ncbi:hypothetical protein BC629DRAFT_1599349 [Irpex lacteus]|nr:hypothetical protein BC629DRAFT_1599349 [Irpex lacteus]
MLRNVSSSLWQHPIPLRIAGPSTFSSHVSTSTQAGPSSVKSSSPPTANAKKTQSGWRTLIDGRVTREHSNPTARDNHQQNKPRTVTRHTGGRPPSGYGAGRAKPLLRPYVLLQRLQLLCKEGKYDEAVSALQKAPLDAQNVVVWNGLIAEVTRARKYQLGYRLYIDMKRRGHKPTGYTYSNLLKGYRDVENWEPLTKQLENVHSLFREWQEHMQALQESDPKHPDLTSTAASAPLNMYISILGTAKLYQKMLDVFNEAYDNGPIHPNAMTYSHVLSKLAERTTLSVKEKTAPVLLQNAADARYIWKQLSKDEEKGLVTPDATCIHNVLRLLARGRASDHLIAFDIIRNYTGLAKPGEAPLKPRVELSAPLFSQVLLVALGAAKPKLCIHYVQQVMDKPIKEGDHTILDTQHMQLAISAFVSIASFGTLGESQRVLHMLEWCLRQGIENPAYGRRIRPDTGVYRSAFNCFWKGTDWTSMMRAFELMTGYDAKDFSDNGGPASSPQKSSRSSDKSLVPDCEMFSAMARTALDTHDQAIMRQCLRIFDRFKVGRLIEKGAAAERKENWGLDKLSVRARKNAFYEVKLAEVTTNLVYAALRKPSDSKAKSDEKHYVPKDDERTRWIELREKAQAATKSYRESPKYDQRYVPRTEDKLLGSERGLFSMDKVVERKLDDRYMESV